MKIRILSIIPRFPQLRIIPGKGSPLQGLVDREGMVLSYDNQRNYPLACAPYATARMLQSALPHDQIEMSVLNLAAVPRQMSLDETWQEKYLSPAKYTIPYGNSTIEVRYIGVAIQVVPGIKEILKNHDLIVVPISFETHVPELESMGFYIKAMTRHIPSLACGTGVWGREIYLNGYGRCFDYVYTGTVQDDGEKILLAILEGNNKLLSKTAGMTLFLDRCWQMSNPASRSFWRLPEKRAADINHWKENLPNYYRWTEPKVTMVGRPDLATGSGANPLLEYCCGFQDLSLEVAAKQSQAGFNAIFAADEIAPVSGCPRECDFCHTAGKGFAQRDEYYIISLLQQYAKWEATDIIPTDDQVVLAAAGNTYAAERQIRIFQTAQKLGMRFFYGNGIETKSLLKIFRQAEKDPVYAEYADLFLDRMGYLQLPLEEENVVIGEATKLRKLSMGISGFEQVLAYVDQYNRRTGREVEVAMNIIMDPLATEVDMREFYERMDKFSAAYPSLTRATLFQEIDSSCAPHVQTNFLRYSDAARYSPVLKLVSIPQLGPMDQGSNWQERQFATLLKVQAQYSTRKLAGGTYR
ncbi:MAG: hypothetical protein M1383_01185 [Patescibacteria group bacterium]|nr:hypothetical protein [Patescibacteria group bacterium]